MKCLCCIASCNIYQFSIPTCSPPVLVLVGVSWTPPHLLDKHRKAKLKPLKDPSFNCRKSYQTKNTPGSNLYPGTVSEMIERINNATAQIRSRQMDWRDWEEHRWRGRGETEVRRLTGFWHLEAHILHRPTVSALAGAKLDQLLTHHHACRSACSDPFLQATHMPPPLAAIHSLGVIKMQPSTSPAPLNRFM